MMSRSFVHVLLSLLLLVTQQMSLLHVTTHFGDARTAGASQAVERGQPHNSGKPALHDFCAQCLDGAQLAFAMPVPAYLFVPLALTDGAPAVPQSAGVVPRTVAVFQPRGPPQVG